MHWQMTPAHTRDYYSSSVQSAAPNTSLCADTSDSDDVDEDTQDELIVQPADNGDDCEVWSVLFSLGTHESRLLHADTSASVCHVQLRLKTNVADVPLPRCY